MSKKTELAKLIIRQLLATILTHLRYLFYCAGVLLAALMFLADKLFYFLTTNTFFAGNFFSAVVLALLILAD